MYLAYSLLLTLGLIVLVPRLIFQALAHGKYISGFPQRLGSLPRTIQSDLPTIWLHCVSVGETQAARPLVKELRRNLPRHRLIVSTITLTGQTLAREVFKDEAAHIIYFPFDWRWCVNRALTAITPDVVLIMETELWPNFLRACRKRGIPVALVNGRISKQSFRGYRLIKWFVARVLSNVNVAAMQSEADAARLRYLGMPNDRLFVSGNLKFDAGAAAVSNELTREIRDRFDFRAGRHLILAASTHAGEERIIVRSFKRLKEEHAQSIRLMIAPRHPERFAEVAKLIENSGLTLTRRSDRTADSDPNAEVILLDTIGELPAAYSLASIVFVGGSMVERGGHNVLEPAAVGSAIVTGAHIDNFEAVVSLLDQNNAIIKLPPLDEEQLVVQFSDVCRKLLESEELRHQMSANAKRMVSDNQGAAEKTLKLISPLFGGSPGSSVSAVLAPHNARN